MTDPTTMSDEELLVAIAEWETGRAARWAPIELLKGAEHLAARAEYMDDKAAYELIKAQANRRGLRRRSAQRRATAGAVEQIWCDVQAGERLVTARAAGRGRHMARAAEDLRIRLQRGLRGLRIADGEVLRGLFLGPIDGNEETDVENLLLTNIEIPAGPLAGGFAFEHDPRSPDGCACGYDYRPVDPVAPFDLWRAGDVVAGWHAFELQHGLIAPAIWWHARARRGTNPPDGGHPPARLMVRIEVTAPRPLTLEELKAATDGVLAAAQWMPRATAPDTEKFRVRLRAAGIATSPDQVTGLLRDPAGATLGPRERLITRGGLVSPSDHLVVAGIVAVTRCPGQRARMTARVHEAMAVVSG